MTTSEEIAARRQILQDQIDRLERRYPLEIRSEAVQALKERLAMLETEAAPP